jgi:O-antigen biosynthesis protein
MREYLIASPGYYHGTGGIKSLHMLCHMLNERGMTAYITGDYVNPDLKTPMAKLLSQEKLRDLQHNGIIIYPDIIPNNPCRWTHCVKFWLGGVQNPPPNQLIYTMSKHHDMAYANSINGYFMVWYIEPYFCLPEVEDRQRPCWYPGKGGDLPRIQGLDHGTFITTGSPPTRIELANILQHATILYVYDSCTVMIQEARLCGCPVQIVGFWPFAKETIQQDPFGMDGVRYLGDEINIEQMRSELPKFKERYQWMLQNSFKELDEFIDKTQNWNPNNIYIDDLGPYNHKIYGHQNFELWATR